MCFGRVSFFLPNADISGMVPSAAQVSADQPLPIPRRSSEQCLLLSQVHSLGGGRRGNRAPRSGWYKENLSSTHVSALIFTSLCVSCSGISDDRLKIEKPGLGDYKKQSWNALGDSCTHKPGFAPQGKTRTWQYSRRQWAGERGPRLAWGDYFPLDSSHAK